MTQDARIERLAGFLVRYSTDVRPGERVSLSGPGEAEALLQALETEVCRACGQPFRLGDPAAETDWPETVNVAIHAVATPESPAAVKPSLVPDDHFWQRSAAGVLRWVAVLVPGAADARNAGLSLEQYAEFLYQAGRLDHPYPAAVWQALRQRQERLVKRLEQARALRFFTPRGTDLRIEVTGRTWINCAGHENFPDGEVFTAPCEGTAEGSVYFDFPSVYEGREVAGVRLVFCRGCVVEASAERGQDWLFHQLGRDAGARTLGEVALGCNYALDRATKHPLLDEKIGGTFHLALGAAYPRTGGRQRSVLHWDLVADLRAGGRVEADGDVLSENGRFVDPSWPQPNER